MKVGHDGALVESMPFEFRPEGHGFGSSRHVETFGKPFTLLPHAYQRPSQNLLYARPQNLTYNR